MYCKDGFTGPLVNLTEVDANLLLEKIARETLVNEESPEWDAITQAEIYVGMLSFNELGKYSTRELEQSTNSEQSTLKAGVKRATPR